MISLVSASLTISDAAVELSGSISRVAQRRGVVPSESLVTDLSAHGGEIWF